MHLSDSRALRDRRFAHRLALLFASLSTALAWSIRGPTSPQALDGAPLETRAGVELRMHMMMFSAGLPHEGTFEAFRAKEAEILGCLREGLPRRVDRDKDQGEVEVAFVIGADGHAEHVTVHGRPEALEHHRRCFLDALSDYDFGRPMKGKGEVLAGFSIRLADWRGHRSRPAKPPARRVYANLEAYDEDTEARMFVLNNLRDVERCYDQFLDEQDASGTVRLRITASEEDGYEHDAWASDPLLSSVADCVTERAQSWDEPRFVARIGPLELDYDMRAEAATR